MTGLQYPHKLSLSRTHMHIHTCTRTRFVLRLSWNLPGPHLAGQAPDYSHITKMQLFILCSPKCCLLQNWKRYAPLPTTLRSAFSPTPCYSTHTLYHCYPIHPLDNMQFVTYKNLHTLVQALHSKCKKWKCTVFIQMLD